jgi:vanillate O-demethylase ferredoxin subunit
MPSEKRPMSAAPITTIRTIVEHIGDGGKGVKVFSLVDPDRWELPPFRPGGHIDLHLPGGWVRTYSLSNDPADNSRYLVAVKREATGRGGSIRLHDEVRVGDTIGVSLPRGGLLLDSRIARFVFIAGGIGVTPFVSAAAFLTRVGRPNFTLHVMARGEPPLAHLLAPLVRAGQVIVHDTAATRRPTIAALVGDPAADTALGCCGPQAMMADFEQATREWSSERIHVERFVAPPLPLDPNAKPYQLILARSNHRVDVRPGQTMLSALRDFGIDVAASCCGGICGACKVDWLEGEPVHRDRVLSPAQRQRSLMVCVAGSAKDRLVLDL